MKSDGVGNGEYKELQDGTERSHVYVHACVMRVCM